MMQLKQSVQLAQLQLLILLWLSVLHFSASVRAQEDMPVSNIDWRNEQNHHRSIARVRDPLEIGNNLTKRQ